MNSNSHQDALRSRWTLQGSIPLAGVAEGAAWYRARSVLTGDAVTLFVVHGDSALETADAVRRAFLVEDPRLLPVRDVVVLDDPRSEPQEGDSSATDGAGTETRPEPLTVVEYPLPTAPPLAALISKGPLHPETARSIIGEAATGLEVARRRGLRHQLLDSNRVFVNTATGEVVVLGVGVEAASHPDLDRSREFASFQDTAALVALLYRALCGRSPRTDENGVVPRPSTLTQQPIPEDLDLLCELVLNESNDDAPDTTRALIEALAPWQSIPVTLEAYGQHPTRADEDATEGRDSTADAGEGETQDAPSPEVAGVAPVDATAPLTPVPPTDEPDTHQLPAQTMPPTAAPDADTTEESDASAIAGAAAAEESARAAAALVKELHLAEKRSSSVFPGHLEITGPPRPAEPAELPAAEGEEPATAPGEMSGSAEAATWGPVPPSPDPSVSSPSDSNSSDSNPLVPDELPARRSGTQWPLTGAEHGPAEPDARPTMPHQPVPDMSPPSANTPAAAVRHDRTPQTTAPVTVVGRTEPVAPVTTDGPIIVRGRDRSALDESPALDTAANSSSSLLRDVVSVAVAADDAETFSLGPAQPEERSRQAQWIILGGVLLVILALVLAISSITSAFRQDSGTPVATATAGEETDEEPAAETPQEETPEPEPEEPALPAAQLAGVELFSADGGEIDNGDQRDRITDGDPGTFWSTKYYATPQYGGLKAPQGVRVDLVEPSLVSAVTVTTARNSGGVLELRTVGENGSPGDVIATGEFAGDGQVRLEPEEPVEAQAIALFIPDLPPDSEQAGKFRARIAEIAVE